MAGHCLKLLSQFTLLLIAPAYGGMARLS